MALTVFWFFFYDWADKRFLYYLFPFCICFLAEGLDALAAWARRGRLAAASRVRPSLRLSSGTRFVTRATESSTWR
ncbi:MAG TPA: hypothetical protein VF316_22895 [Polyangiaceae bacterium]